WPRVRLGANDQVSRQRRTHLTADDGLTENISVEARAEAPPSTSRITRSRKSSAEDSLNSALLGILLRRIRFSPNEKCSNSRSCCFVTRHLHCRSGGANT